MHISDGILPASVWIGSYIIAGTLVAYTIRRISPEDIPKIAVMTSCFFVASLIHIPLGPTSVHLALNGLCGIILGKMAFLSIFVGLIMQALLFKHGGITTIGANSLMMSLPALLASRIFKIGRKRVISAGISGGGAVFLSSLILALFLMSTGCEFFGVAKYTVFAHLPVVVIEGMVSSLVISFILRVRPKILNINEENSPC
jgi:cobalt/nickel transport system permease protein